MRTKCVRISHRLGTMSLSIRSLIVIIYDLNETSVLAPDRDGVTVTTRCRPTHASSNLYYYKPSSDPVGTCGTT